MRQIFCRGLGDSVLVNSEKQLHKVEPSLYNRLSISGSCTTKHSIVEFFISWHSEHNRLCY